MSKKLFAFLVTIAAIIIVTVWGDPASSGQACISIGLAGSAYVGTQAGVDAMHKYKGNG